VSVVPDVTGLTTAAAEAALVEVGLVLGEVTEAYSATVAAGLVLSQEPVADTEVDEGSAVDVVVSKGKEPVTPTGVLGQVVDGLRKCVAASTTFQKAVGAEDETAALAYVHAWHMDEAVDPPFAFVAPAHERRERVSSAGAYPERGGVLLLLVLETVEPDPLEAFFDFDNKRDAIISEVAAAAESSGYVHIRAIELDADGYGLWGAREGRARGKQGIQAWHQVTWGF